jgi:integrase
MAERIRINHGTLEAGKRLLQQWRIPKTVKRELLRFLDDLALGKVNRGKRISEHRQLKYLHALRAPLVFLNKPTADLTSRDIERFERALVSGKLCTQLKGKPFAHNTQVDIRMLFRIFLRWRLGSTKASRLTDWFDTRARAKTPDFLKEPDVERLYKYCRNAEQKFLIAVLFDSGCRAEEFHNIRFEDVHLPEGKETLVRIEFKQEYSKTLGRTVPLFWKFSPEAVKEYLAERIAEGIRPTDPVFRSNYAANKKLLQRLGLRILKRPIHYHLFRHSSATWYATKLNRHELCTRYGWRFSSNMPDVYISRAGMETKDLEEKFIQTELSALKAELTDLKQMHKIREERMQKLEVVVDTFRRNWPLIAKVLHLGRSEKEIEAVLRKKGRRPGVGEA